MVQLGPKLGATSAQVKRPNTKSSKNRFHRRVLRFFLASKLRVDSNVPYVVSPLDPNWYETVTKGSQVGPCWTWPGPPCASTWLQLRVWIHLGPTSASITNWLQLGLNLGPTKHHMGPSREWAAGPTRWNVRVYVHARPCSPQLGYVGHCWAQVGTKWPEFGASCAQVEHKLACVRPRTAKFDTSRLWLVQVGPRSSPRIPTYQLLNFEKLSLTCTIHTYHTIRYVT